MATKFFRRNQGNVVEADRFSFTTAFASLEPDQPKIAGHWQVYVFSENPKSARAVIITGESQSSICADLRTHFHNVLFEIRGKSIVGDDLDACLEQEMLNKNGHGYAPGPSTSMAGLCIRWEWQRLEFTERVVQNRNALGQAGRNVGLGLVAGIGVTKSAAAVKDYAGALSDSIDFVKDRVGRVHNTKQCVALLVGVTEGHSTERTKLTALELADAASGDWMTNPAFGWTTNPAFA